MLTIKDMKFSKTELNKLICKFDLENLENFGLLLYFAGFSGETKDVVDYLNKIRIFLRYNGGFRLEKLSFGDILKTLSEKELNLINELLDEAEMCALSDERYMEYSHYFNDLKCILENESAQKLLKKNK